VKFPFIAKHRGILPVECLCGALDVSRGGFYAWLTRPRSRRSRSDDQLGAKVRTSFLASDRTHQLPLWRSSPVVRVISVDNIGGAVHVIDNHRYRGSSRVDLRRLATHPSQAGSGIYCG
jgi:hypothetical protein